MNQKLSPDAYAALRLPDQHIEEIMQETEAAWIVEQTAECRTVLDLGWGSGIVAKALNKAGKQIVVVDGARESCHIAWEHHGIVSYHAMFEDFVIGTEKFSREFDCVIASFILEHVADPVALLKRMTAWAPKLIAVIGNAGSWHRRIAVEMGLQPRLDTLSARDHKVGHHRVYSLGGDKDAANIFADLRAGGWHAREMKGLMLKPLPNSMMMHFDERLIRAICSIEVAPKDAANVGIICERIG